MLVSETPVPGSIKARLEILVLMLRFFMPKSKSIKAKLATPLHTLKFMEAGIKNLALAPLCIEAKPKTLMPVSGPSRPNSPVSRS